MSVAGMSRAEEMPVRLGPVSARNRDVELGVTPHAVLGDVESRGLRPLVGADAPEGLHHPETGEGQRERPDADDGDA